MIKLKNLFKKLKDKKGLTGADLAAAVTIVVLGVGVATSIYVNSSSKAKDNIRYSNAVRIATSVVEGIQKQPYEYLTGLCKNGSGGDTYTFKGSNTSDLRPFGVKVPGGYDLTVIAKKAGTPDIARDVVVKVKYKSSKTYKTITLSTMKEKELLDKANPPDLSLLPGYNPNDTSTFYYPVKIYSTDRDICVVTTEDDIEWKTIDTDLKVNVTRDNDGNEETPQETYDADVANFPLYLQTKTANLNIGDKISYKDGILWVWIPRYVRSGEVPLGIGSIQFLYGTSNYSITWNDYGDVSGYGVSYNGEITENSVPKKYYETLKGSGYFGGFVENYGGSGLWIDLNGGDGNYNWGNPQIIEGQKLKEEGGDVGYVQWDLVKAHVEMKINHILGNSNFNPDKETD